MLKWLIARRLSAFERDYAYDASYVRDLLETDPRAFFAVAKLGALGSYCKGVPREVHHAVKIVGTMWEDCGPCTQLNVTMALRAGVAAQTVSAVLRGDEEAMSDDVLLGVGFARAVLAHDAGADALRSEIERRWGARAVISLAFALAAARLYPTLKYALGHAKGCQRVMVAGVPVPVLRGAT